MPKVLQEIDSRKEALLESGILEFSKKPYNDASTDEITNRCGISKGLLFHYFGNKRSLYITCLERALERLTSVTPEVEGDDFLNLLFLSMDAKIKLCYEFPDETRLVNMAAREMAKDVFEEKKKLFKKYLVKTQENSTKVMLRAVSKLKLKKPAQAARIADALLLYTKVLVERKLEQYIERPEEFFARRSEIQDELKEYLDFMLDGIVKEE